MAKAAVLDLVDANLAAGHTHLAIQRLASLIIAHPTDLDLRWQLATIYRRVGNVIEAGRWGYLHPSADPTELTAFERAYPGPAIRLRRLLWPAQAAYPENNYARQRLAALTVAAPPAAPARRLLMICLISVGTLAALLAILGAVTVVQWIVG